ncbi:MAG: urate hydroxylase PuuD [Bdellovibrionales bacterium]|nr:urate hydroxylase PuuD [Bdellovibrionales bacterium]
MNQDFYEWILLLGRWLHITVGITWIGTSIFFMWLDRTFQKNMESTKEGHVGEVWMVHGGGFYHVEKLLMGPTKVPKDLHWFKWEAYWTWLSGAFLMLMIFYSGDGTYLLDADVSKISYAQAVCLGVFTLVGSWVFYDFLWEREITRNKPLVGHFFTIAWFVGMTYILCHTLSGRAAYMHIGGMIGTWMTANVFMRIIPRQLKMVEASKSGTPVNQEWAKNAKNRSTHNTYFTLPVILIMISNHFPMTYGSDYNWLILLCLSAAGACIREYFVVRIKNPGRSKAFGALGVVILATIMFFNTNAENNAEVPAPVAVTQTETPADAVAPQVSEEVAVAPTAEATPVSNATVDVKGVITFTGTPPQGKKLTLPGGCKTSGPSFSNEVMVNNGKVENVLVRVTKGLEGKSFKDVPAEPVVLDQKNCIYHPRVAAARVGQEVVFVNSDPVFHNVRSMSKANTNFNLAMPKQNQRISKRFEKTEFFVQAKCSIHPWMAANLAIVEHPFFAVTNPKGEFTLKALPVGTYTVEVWHEVFGTQTKEITVTENGKVDLNFNYKQ